MPALDALHPIAAIDPGGATAQRQTGDLPFLAKLELSQRLRATVEAGLSNGEFVVVLRSQDGRALDGPALHMKLPAGVRPGDMLNLIFVAREPRPEFALVSDTLRGADSPLLSVTGRFINDLLRRPIFPDNPTVLSTGAPLLGGPPGDGIELSLRLAQALGRSGLFYESHQAQWVAGAKPFSELLMEPQAHLAGPGSRLRNADKNDANLRAPVNLAVRNNASVHGFVDSDRAHPEPITSDPVHRDALALVRQQLEVLETRHIAWQGEAWPGQAIALEAFEEEWREPGERDEPDQACAVPWKTYLRLTLPNLGQVAVHLRLHQHGLEVSLTAPDHAAKAILQSGAASLAHGLERAGIKLLSMGVNIHEEQG